MSNGGNNEKDKKKSQIKGKNKTTEKVSEKEREREREKRGVEREKLLSKIYGNRIVGFHWSKRQSRSTHRELCVGTKILEFCQTPRGKEFSYFEYF